MVEEVKSHTVVFRPVVVRSHDVSLAFPWPHWVGALPSEEPAPPTKSESHPFRAGEFYRAMHLHGAMDDLEVGTVVAALCTYNRFGYLDSEKAEVSDSPEVILREVVGSDGFVVGGGLEVCRTTDVVLTPSCCCGLETWREWIAFAEGGPAPWSGHDPDPYIERLPSGLLAIGYAADRENALQTSPSELREALRLAELDLCGFLHLLERWASVTAPSTASAFANAFGQAMNVTTE